MIHLLTPVQANLCRRMLENMCHPVFLLFVGVILLAVYVCFKNSSSCMKVVALLTVSLLFLLSTPWLPKYLINRLQDAYHPIKQIDPHVQWIVVLGGGCNEIENLPLGEVLSASSMKRVLEGVRLKKLLPQATLLFSGGSMRGDAHYAVGERMHEFALLVLGKTMQDEVENDSINTAEEVIKVREMIGDAPFYLVTSALHMPRSMQLFEHAGMHPIPAPCDYIYFWDKESSLSLYIPGAYNLAYFNKVWHELLGLFWGRLRGIL